MVKTNTITWLYIKVLKNKSYLLTLFYLFFFKTGYSQIMEENKDSTEAVYEKIEDYSEKTKAAKFLHVLIFKSKKQSKKKSTSAPKQDYSNYEGKIVRHIKIESHDPFGFSFTDTTKTAKKWIEKTGNKIHVRSKDFAVKNYLIFKENEPLDGLLLKESERLLRSKNFIRDVEITVRYAEESRDSVDVHITTLDSWSLVPGGSISDSKIKFKLKEQNYLGFGHQLKIGAENRFDDGKFTHDLVYTMPNFKNTYISSTVGYSTYLDDSYNKRFNLKRPFFSPYTKWAAGIYLDEQFKKKRVINDGTEVNPQNFKYQSQDVWAGYSFPLFKGKSERERTTNIIGALRLLNINYKQRPTIEYDSIGFFSNETFYLGSLGISSRQFVKDRYIFRDGITENVPIGDIYAITAGKQYKNERYRWYLGTKIAHGDYYKWGYVNVSLEFGTFLKDSKTEQTSYSLNANYFTHLISLGSDWKMRQFIKPQLIIGKNRLNSIGDRLSLDEENDFKSFYGNEEELKNSIGIPGFDSHILGTSKYVLSLQTQFYPPWGILGFRFNPYLNISLGMLGDDKLRINDSKLYSSFSVGLIIRNDYLVFNSFQLSLSYFPNVPGQGNHIFNTNALKTEDFGLQGFELGKPSPVWYN